MNYLTTIAFHNDNPIFARDLIAYKKDSARSLTTRKAWKRRLVRAGTHFHLNALLSRMTLANSTTSVLAFIGAGLLASHCVYA